MATSVVPLIVAVALAGGASRTAGGAAPVADASVPIARGQVASGQIASAPVASVPTPPGAGGAAGTVGVAEGEFSTRFTLADAGVSVPIRLRGGDTSRSVGFSVPRNQMVKTAVLRLNYHLSPGLVAGSRQLNISLNGTLVTTLAVGTVSGPDAQGSTGATLVATVALPAEMLVEDNQLSFEFAGHSATGCRDAADSEWARIDPASSLELAGSLLPLANDLKVLPLPFYGRGMDPHPVVPMVFLTAPSAKAIQAAGVIASWFGVLNGTRPVRFSVSVGKIPEGNAIVIVERAADLPSSLGGSPGSGATIAMTANPSDPGSNLLLVAGGNPDRLLAAAKALTLHGDTWQGSLTTIRAFDPPAARQADDAPRWLSAEGDGGFLAESAALEQGSSINFRLPPDLSFGERKNLGFHLSYRYNGIPLGAGSTLQVYVNGAFVSSIPLPHTEQASTVLETIVPIPVVDLRPFSNTITFHFAFQSPPGEGCSDAGAGDFEGTVLKDSFLDIAGLSHVTSLPDLALFANAGYPFTRSADLGETTVVLPDRPSAAELEMFLALMGHFGAQTGYPALRVTVTDADGMTRQGTGDYLLMGTAQDQPALRVLSGSLPVDVSGDSLKINDTGSLFDPPAWWSGHSAAQEQSGRLETEGGLPDAVIEESEWPAGSNRTVVAIIVRDDAGIGNFVTALLAKSQTSEIAKSVSVLDQDRFSSYRVGGDIYRVGKISPVERLSSIFQQAPWLIAVIAVTFCFVMAALIQAMLRRHARDRLQVDGE